MPRSPTHIGKTTPLPFAAEQGITIANERAARKRGKPKGDLQVVSIWPYLTLKVYPSGKAGGEKLVNTSLEHVRASALAHRDTLRRDLAIVEQWIKAWDAGEREEFEIRP